MIIAPSKICIYSLFILIISCEILFNPTLKNVYVDNTIIADGFGNNDGIASDSEMTFIVDYFKKNEEAWAMGGIPESYSLNIDRTHIPADTLRKSITTLRLYGPFPGEKAFRDYYGDISIRTPWLGIYVLKRNIGYYIYRFFRAPGPKIGQAEWIELEII